MKIWYILVVLVSQTTGLPKHKKECLQISYTIEPRSVRNLFNSYQEKIKTKDQLIYALRAIKKSFPALYRVNEDEVRDTLYPS